MLKKILINCSGSDKDILSKCAVGEQTKFVGIGATVLFTAIMAFIACSYALYTVFDNPFLAMGFGFIWGLLIFNLDRFIVSTMKKRGSFYNEFLQALPRIILAIIIAVVISKPLEIKLFKKEINTVLLKQKNAMALRNKNQVGAYYKSDLGKNNTEIINLISEIKKKELEVNAYYENYIAEAEGFRGTKKIGKGPVFKEKIAKHDLAKKELDSIKEINQKKILEIEKQNKILLANIDQKIVKTQPIIDEFDGLMASINALGKVSLMPSLFIMLLFLAIETSPIITKLLSPKSEYDYRSENEEMALKSILEYESLQQELLINSNITINNKVYDEMINDEKIYNSRYKNIAEMLEKQDKILRGK